MRPLLYIGAALALVALTTAAIADDAKDQRQLQGEWALASATRGGKSVLKEGEKHTSTFDAEKMTLSDGRDKKMAKVKLDTSKKPPQIDILPQDGSDKGRTIKGIYELKDDVLKVCFGEPDGDRPTTFSAKEGEKFTLAEFKRAKK